MEAERGSAAKTASVMVTAILLHCSCNVVFRDRAYNTVANNKLIIKYQFIQMEEFWVYDAISHHHLTKIETQIDTVTRPKHS